MKSHISFFSMATSRKTAKRQNTYRNNSAKPYLTSQKHQICRKLSTTDEIINALKATQAGKAAGPDGIFPHVLQNIGPAAARWLQAFYDDMMATANNPKIWRSANVIAIRKHGKHIDEPTGYRPISILCCCYKLLEHLLLTRLAPTFESVIPTDQAGFRKKRNTCDHVLTLTSNIESGLQKRPKTGAVLIDLNVACDTVWQAGLMMKLSNAIKWLTTIILMVTHRQNY